MQNQLATQWGISRIRAPLPPPLLGDSGMGKIPHQQGCQGFFHISWACSPALPWHPCHGLGMHMHAVRPKSSPRAIQTWASEALPLEDLPSPHKHEANQSGTYLTPPGRQKPWALCSLSQRACPSSSFPPAQAGPENIAQKTALLQLEGQRGPRPTGTGGRWSPVPNPYFLTLTFASQSTRPPETGAGGVGGDNTVTDIQNLPA